MNHILNLDHESLINLENIFENIANGNTVLILGAGASVTDKKYLSQQIIEYYENKIGRQFNIPNITKLIDVLETESFFDRKKFDQFVYDLLNNLEVAEAHKIIASTPWKQIITTNYDLLIERAFDLIKNTSSYNNTDIIPIRTIQEYNSLSALNEIKLIKLHGCMSDKSKYPFIFSTQDFNSSKRFYKAVLSGIKNPSYKINFLSIGNSFSDSFSYSFLETLDREGYRDRRILYNVDPYVNENMLNYFTSQKIVIIKLTCAEFFNQYKLWEERNIEEKLISTKKLVIRDSNNSNIILSGKLLNSIKYSLEQLNSSYKGSYISIKDFYTGDDPDYAVILKNFDIIKQKLIEDTSETIVKIINNGMTTSLLPICFLTGTFGTGKTTITYRIINQLLESKNLDLLVFEVKDVDYLRINDIIDLINSIKPKYFILHFDKVEVDSVFKRMIAIRLELSSKQISQTNILFLASIRINILEKYKTNDYRNTHEFNIDQRLTKSEIEEFLEKLQQCELIKIRDQQEKMKLVYKVQREYDSDSFLSLVQLVTNGKHIDNLRDAYFQLSDDCKIAFLYTSLLHRFNIQMPSSLLKSLISKDWETFKTNVIDKEGKGLLLQEVISSKDLEPDLYFKTKHPLIADLLVKNILKQNEILKYYNKIILNISQSPKLTKLTINLLKALSNCKDLSSVYINSLFDNAYANLNSDPYFILNYSINLQHRHTEKDLLRSRELLMIAEGLLDYRNDKFIHRRAVVAFELAKLYFKEEKNELIFSSKFLSEAKDFFEIKQLLDPCSSFSYIDYLLCLIWELDNIQNTIEEELRLKVLIEDQFETAHSAITEGLSKIFEIKTDYIERYHDHIGSNNYLKQLDEMYGDHELRPYACILKFNYYYEKGESEDCLDLIDEMMEYAHIQEICKFLFRYHSHRLNYVENRINFFDVIKKAYNIEEIKTLNYNYFMFVAESYNGNFGYAFSFLKNINESFNYLNPDYKQIWKESDSDNPRLFDGFITTNRNNNLVFRSYEFQNNFYLKKDGIVNTNKGSKVRAKLHFYLNGIRAEIVNQLD